MEHKIITFNTGRTAMKKEYSTEAEMFNGLIAILMACAALAYALVVGLHYQDPDGIPAIMALPFVGLIFGALWFLIKPDNSIER